MRKLFYGLFVAALCSVAHADNISIPQRGVTSAVVNGTFDLTTATGATQDLTYTFTPVSCSGYGAVNASASNNLTTFMAFSDGTNSSALSGNTNNVSGYNTGRFFTAFDAAGTSGQVATITFALNKATLTWTKTGAPTGTFSYSVRCFR